MGNKSNNICVDLGGSSMKVALISDGKIKDKKVSKIKDTNDTFAWLKQLEDIIEEIRDDCKTINGISIAFAGPTKCAEKKLLPSNGKYEKADEADLVSWAKKWTDNLVVDNDARLACVGEWQFGAGKGYSDIVAVTLGTGFGTSAIINNRVIHGAHDLAGCLGGHFRITLEDDVPCTCGSFGCVEALASTDRLGDMLDRFIHHSPRVKRFDEVFALARNNNEEYIALENYLFKVWGTAIVSLVNAYDPKVVVICGGIMSDCEEHIIPKLQEYSDKHQWKRYDKILLKPGSADESALYGGYYMLEEGRNNVAI